MIDLGSKATGADIDSENWLRSSKGSWIKLVQNLNPNQKLRFTHLSHQRNVILKDWWFNLTMYGHMSQYWLGKINKIDKDIRVNIESRSEIELPSWDLGHIHIQVQFQGSKNLPNCHYSFQNFDFGQIENWYNEIES